MRVRAQDTSGGPPARAVLSWERGPGAEECIGAPALEKALENHLGYAAFAAEGILSVHGAVSRSAAPPGFRAEVELRDREGKDLGRREVEVKGAACRALDEALVLVLALAIDAQLSAAARSSAPVQDEGGGLPAPPNEAQPPPAPAPAPEPVPTASSPPPPPAPPAPIERPEPEPERPTPSPVPGVHHVSVKGTGRSYGLVIAAGAGLGLGLMPAPAWNAAFALAWRTPSAFSIELRGVLFPFGRVPTSEGRVDFRAGYAELRGCAPLLRIGLELDACVGLWNGVLHASASGFEGSSSRLTPLSGATGQVRAAWEFRPRVFARASLGAGVPFVRERFMLQSSAGRDVELHRVAPVLGFFGLDFGVQLR
jgi:hypothetical protein